MTEIGWDWPEIAIILMWRLAPKGVVITRRDLGRLPMDRVLLEDRRPAELHLRWITLAEAQSRTQPKNVLEEKASVSELQGRWQKLAVVLMWKFAQAGIVLTESDRQAVPNGQEILTRGFKDDIEFRFAPRTETAKIEQAANENDGTIIREKAAL